MPETGDIVARAGTSFFCTSCGSETLKWEGRCPACGEWNALAESPSEGGEAAGRTRKGAPRAGGSEPAPLREARDEGGPRRSVGIAEVDRVLGGGLVPGSLVLLGGAPGIGKSTLLLQLAANLVADGASVLYVSGEESAAQVGMRAERLGGTAPDVPFLAETDVEAIVDHARSDAPDLLCVDSIQTLHAARLDSAAGGVSQVRECAAHLQALAKEAGVAVVLVGHVTKQGGLAGPRTLEHVVDAVLTFEGDRTVAHRMLRAVKNRFGGVDELAVFSMTSKGLEAVPHPSEIFLADRPQGVSGSAVAIPLLGSRPLVAEVQALTSGSEYGTPQRVVTGLPGRRLSLLLAVLERRGGIGLAGSDVFVNIVGGLELRDRATDLSVLAALASAQLDRPLPGDRAFLGEVGLGGEIRGVTQVKRRAREAARSGMVSVVAPAGTAKGAGGDIEVVEIEHVRDLVRLVREDG
ncbi:MAG: DNA repair protein RadA [Gemmatimonadota bacterium]